MNPGPENGGLASWQRWDFILPAAVMGAGTITAALLIYSTFSPATRATLRASHATNPPTAPTATAAANTILPSSNLDGLVARTNLPPAPAPSVASRFPDATNWLAHSRLRLALKSADTNSYPDIIEQNGRKYLNITFAKLAAYSFDEDPRLVDEGLNPYASLHAREQVPDAVKNLGEKTAAVTGFMLPLRVENGLATDFLLLRNQSACCLGIMPRINEYVIVHTVAQGIKPLKDVPLTALGTFHVGEMRQGGHLIGIYLFDCERLLATN